MVDRMPCPNPDCETGREHYGAGQDVAMPCSVCGGAGWIPEWDWRYFFSEVAAEAVRTRMLEKPWWSEAVVLPLIESKPDGRWKLRVTRVDAWGAVQDHYTFISPIEVERSMQYFRNG